MQGSKLTGLICLVRWIGEKSGIGAGARHGMHSCLCGFCKPSLIWPFPCREVSWSISICRGKYQKSPEAHRMLSAHTTLHHLCCEVKRQPERSTQSSHTSYPSHGSSRPHLPILIMWIHQASSACAENTAYDSVPFWRLCPSPILDCHLC